jgi:integrase
MPKTAKPLSAREVATIKKPGTYFDGHGLALRVGPTGAKSWIFRYTGADGKRHDLGLGPTHTVSLAEARELALQARKARRQDKDPLAEKREARQRHRVAAAKAMTFAAAADAYIQSQMAGWRDPRSAPQWRASLRDHALPVIGALPVDAVDTGLVMQCLSPIWTTRTETASRVRARIESILDWARVAGYREGENPARWKAHLENLLPKKNKVRPVEHHAALEHSQIGAFMAELRQQEGVAARALEFVILTACRVGEVIGARWSEIDLNARVWIIPAERMKAAQAHRVPLSEAALEIIEKMAAHRRSDDYLFPGIGAGRPISASAIRIVMDRIGAGSTTHGMRACFRSWCADHGIARDLAEQCLAHATGNAVEQAYNRTDLLERRRPIMADWARFCAVVAPNDRVVVPLRAAAASQ